MSYDKKRFQELLNQPAHTQTQAEISECLDLMGKAMDERLRTFRERTLHKFLDGHLKVVVVK